MKNYNKLVKVIQAASPEIMELKLGCEVMVRGIREDNPGCENDVVIDGRIDKDNRIGLGYFGQVPIEGCEILGRPIRLADVLMAYNEIHDSMSAKRFAIYFNGQVVYWDDDEKAHLECVWNLKDNSLDNQSDETKQFLIDLLVK